MNYRRLAICMFTLCAGWNVAKADVYVLPSGPAVPSADPPIVYQESATGSGTLGGKTFTNALITITFTGDTSTVTGAGGFFTNSVGTKTVSVSGIGSGTFTDSISAFVNQGGIGAGFGDNVTGTSILDTVNAAFSTYNLTTFIGPLSGSSFIRPDQTFGTSLGGLNIQSAGNATFTASPTAVVPEPSSIILLITVLAGTVYWIPRKNIKA